jgi:hypothetical protein
MGKVVSVSEIIESDVNGTFTYNVKFEKGIQSLVCGHDIVVSDGTAKRHQMDLANDLRNSSRTTLPG